MLSDAFVRGIMGPVGSGKTTACLIECMRRSMMQEPGPDGIRRVRGAVIRNTYPELKTTTIKSWHEWFPPTVGNWAWEGPPRHRMQFEGYDIEVLFLALDRPEDISRLLSLEITWAYVNEARELGYPVIRALLTRIGRYPAMRQGGATWKGLVMDTNPPDTDHWWYRLAEEECPPKWAFFKQPAGDSVAAENLDHLSKDYYENVKSGASKEFIKVYVHGEYGFVQDGKAVFPEFIDSLHVAEVAPIRNRPIVIGLDFGLTPAAVFLQADAEGRVRALQELVAEDMGVKRFSEVLGAEIRAKYSDFDIEIVGDPAGDSRAQTDETTPFQILNAAGLRAKPANSNDTVVRLEAVRACLGRLVGGKPGLIVDPKCATLRKGLMGGYRYKRVAVAGGGERFRDRPEKNSYSHVCDALQYGLLGLGEGRALVRNKALDDFKGPRRLHLEREGPAGGHWMGA